jgi:hypothetical protein
LAIIQRQPQQEICAIGVQIYSKKMVGKKWAFKFGVLLHAIYSQKKFFFCIQ